MIQVPALAVAAIVGPFLGAFRHTASLQEIAMSHIITRQRTLSVVEHVLAIVVGFIFMVLGLGLSVTMIMLPIGLIVGLAGFAMFVSGICVRFDWI